MEEKRGGGDRKGRRRREGGRGHLHHTFNQTFLPSSVGDFLNRGDMQDLNIRCIITQCMTLILYLLLSFSPSLLLSFLFSSPLLSSPPCHITLLQQLTTCTKHFSNTHNHSIACCMILRVAACVAACSCVLLRVAACSCVLLRVAACCCVLLRVAACCCVLLRVAACCCVLLRGVACCCGM